MEWKIYKPRIYFLNLIEIKSANIKIIYFKMASPNSCLGKKNETITVEIELNA